MTEIIPPICVTCKGNQMKDHSDYHWICLGCGKMFPKDKFKVIHHEVKPKDKNKL